MSRSSRGSRSASEREDRGWRPGGAGGSARRPPPPRPAPVPRTPAERGRATVGGEAAPAVWLHTFGCKANQYDTERIRQELESRGARTVAAPERAQVAVVNSCAVTGRAEVDARRLVRRLRRERPGMRILVVGCAVALREADYRAMPEVDDVVPGQDPARVAAALAGAGVPALRMASPGRPTGGSVLFRAARGTRAWLKVQDGCDRRCSFCATRIVRGASRSRPPEEVVREARLLAEAHPELVITGINIGHYGRDLPEPTSLGRLVGQLLEELPGTRLRLGSIEVTELDETLEELLVTSGGQLAPHLHLPLQSGSDAILRRMRRWHTREGYRRRVLKLAERMPILGLGADVIVGFPGEGNAEFAETRALVEELPYTYLHVFPFSARERTAAASLPGRVPPGVTAARSRELRQLAASKGRAYRARRAGEMADVVVEGGGEGAPGLTGDYLRVEVRGGDAAPGERITARLRLDGETLYVEAAAHPAA